MHMAYTCTCITCMHLNLVCWHTDTCTHVCMSMHCLMIPCVCVMCYAQSSDRNIPHKPRIRALPGQSEDWPHNPRIASNEGRKVRMNGQSLDCPCCTILGLHPKRWMKHGLQVEQSLLGWKLHVHATQPTIIDNTAFLWVAWMLTYSIEDSAK